MEYKQPSGVLAASISLCGRIIGESPAMQNVRQRIVAVAEADVPVLITGESGTGKELVAQSLHSLSKRRNQLPVSINCSAIPDALLESELFGFEKGAFTGAIARHDGAILQANFGTLFLDEIGELSAASQASTPHRCSKGRTSRCPLRYRHPSQPFRASWGRSFSRRSALSSRRHQHSPSPVT
jgi:transcriptional regulator with GAF, ATPase, and Fis domain